MLVKYSQITSDSEKKTMCGAFDPSMNECKKNHYEFKIK